MILVNPIGVSIGVEIRRNSRVSFPNLTVQVGFVWKKQIRFIGGGVTLKGKGLNGNSKTFLGLVVEAMVYDPVVK